MSKAEFKLDTAAFGRLVMKSPQMLALTEKEAKRIVGQDTHLKPFIGFDRAKTVVYPNTMRHPS